ncbi:MAG: DUF3368 domain-containing protein [Elainellaceae cyanobacterium]
MIPSVRPVLDQLLSAANFRISNQLYVETLAIAGEELMN